MEILQISFLRPHIFYKKTVCSYTTEKPHIMLPLVFFSKFVRDYGKCCDSCNKFIITTYTTNNMYVWYNRLNNMIHQSCLYCYDKAKLYFDLTPIYYLHFKQLFLRDIACYIVNCYYTYKLQNITK